MAGFGAMPFGGGPFGLATPPAPAEATTGGGGSRFIDPTSKDYGVDSATGQYAQMPPTRQQVLIALTTLFNSSGVTNFGVRLPKRMGDTFEAECKSAVASALRHLTEIQKVIRVDLVKIDKGAGGRARITVQWFDLVTGQRDQLQRTI